jgi:hypothetical protein
MGVWEAVWEAVWTASQTGSWEPVWEAVWTASQTGSQEPVWEAVWTASQTGCLATSLDTTPDRVLTQVWVASLQSDAGVGGSNPCWCGMRSATWLLPNAPRLLDTLVAHQVCSV